MRACPELQVIPVIIMTSPSEPADHHRAYAFGASSYLVTTIDLKSMRQILRGIGVYATVVASRPVVRQGT